MCVFMTLKKPLIMSINNDYNPNKDFVCVCVCTFCSQWGLVLMGSGKDCLHAGLRLCTASLHTDACYFLLALRLSATPQFQLLNCKGIKYCGSDSGSVWCLD